METERPLSSFVLAVIFLAIVLGTYFFIFKEQAVTEIKEVPNFSVEYSPSRIILLKGSDGAARITVTPDEGFSDNVSFSVRAIMRGEAEIQESGEVRAQFVQHELTSKDINEGTVLVISAISTAQTGDYVIIIDAMAEENIMSVSIPLTIQ